MARNRRSIGVVAQFPNRSGATVDVSGVSLRQWHCNGCPARKYFGPAEERMSEAQAHADQCSGLPGHP